MPSGRRAGCRCSPLARAGSRSQLVTRAPRPGRQQLAAVRVPGEHRLVAVGGELVEHPEVRRVRDAHADVGRGVGRTRDGWRGRRTPGAGRRRRRTRTVVPLTVSRSRRLVRSTQPRRSKPSRRSPYGQLGGVGIALAVVGQQVAHRVAHGRREVVVGAEHEDARHVEQVAERVEHRRDRVRVRQVVAGVHDQVGLQLGQRLHPGPLAALARGQVQVARRAAPAAARGRAAAPARWPGAGRTTAPRRRRRTRGPWRRREPPAAAPGRRCGARGAGGSPCPRLPHGRRRRTAGARLRQ